MEPNLRKIVYCTAVREGTEKEWFHIDYQLSTAQSMFELNALRDAMGCTKLKWLLARYMQIFQLFQIIIQLCFPVILPNSFQNNLTSIYLKACTADILKKVLIISLFAAISTNFWAMVLVFKMLIQCSNRWLKMNTEHHWLLIFSGRTGMKLL